MPLTKVSAGVIAANAVNDSFGTQSITGDKLGLTAINANNIVGGAVTGDKLGATSINANNIVGGTITTTQIASNTISNTNIQTGAIEVYSSSRSTGLFDGMRNRIINGAMVINQRALGTTTINSGSAWVYTIDRWSAIGESALGVYTLQQSSTAPAGFVNSLLATVTTSTTPSSGHLYVIRQPIEGFNVADLGWGTANAKTVTLSFQVYSSLTGTFGGSLQNSASNRSYPFTYSIPTANTWTTISVTIAGDTSGTWVGATNGVGIYMYFGLGIGSTYSGTAGAWAGANYLSATGATSVISTNGATFYITGVQLEVGSTATSFDYRPYGTELQLCQRYYYKIAEGGSAYTQFGAGRAFSTTEGNGIVPFPVPMRSAPTFAYLGAVGDYDFSPTAISGGAVPASNTHMTVGMTFSSITSGSMFWLGANAGASGPAGFTFSAEL